MSQIRVVTWNAEGMFVEGTETRRALPHQALETLKKLDADIVVIPAFGRLSDLRDEVKTTIESLGYDIATIEYDEPRTPGLGFAILSRLAITETTVHDLRKSKRQMLEVVCHDDDGIHMRVFGVHLNDMSEDGRLDEITTVTEIINLHADAPMILLGDFNAMHRDALFAKVARTRIAHTASRHISHELLHSMAERVHEMAIGTTIDYLLSHTALHDMDTSRKRTISARQAGLEWIPSWRLAKIDWIFGSQHFSTAHYRVLPDVGSDHRPVVADLIY